VAVISIVSLCTGSKVEAKLECSGKFCFPVSSVVHIKDGNFTYANNVL
jgi:hypothetical protein